MANPEPVQELPVLPRADTDFSLFQEWTCLDGVSERPLCHRGVIIYSPGEPADCVFLLKSGKVKIVRCGPDAKRLIVHLVGLGEIFGELALVGELYRENSAEIVEDAALWVIPCKAVLDWLHLHPGAWREMAAFFAKRLRYLEGAVQRLLFGEVEHRVIRLLLDLANQYGDPGLEGVNLGIELSQREIAHLIGSTRETTSSVLNQLARRGLIRIRRRRLSICSMEDLSQLARETLAPRIPPGSEAAPRANAARQSGSL